MRDFKEFLKKHNDRQMNEEQIELYQTICYRIMVGRHLSFLGNASDYDETTNSLCNSFEELMRKDDENVRTEGKKYNKHS